MGALQRYLLGWLLRFGMAFERSGTDRNFKRSGIAWRDGGICGGNGGIRDGSGGGG